MAKKGSKKPSGGKKPPMGAGNSSSKTKGMSWKNGDSGWVRSKN